MADILIDVTAEQLEDVAKNGLRKADIEQEYNPESENPISAKGVTQALEGFTPPETDDEVTKEYVDNEINKVKGSIEEIENTFETGKNLIDETKIIADKVVSVSGKITDNTSYKITEPIYLEAGTYVFSKSSATTSNNFRLLILDTADATSGTYTTENPFTLDSPKYVIVCNYKATTEWQLELGTVATEYEPYYKKIKEEYLPTVTIDTEMSNTSENPVQNKAIKAYIDNKENGGSNKQNFLITEFNDKVSGWVGIDGAITEGDGKYRSDLMPVIEGKTYYISGFVPNAVGRAGAFYNVSKTFIRHIKTATEILDVPYISAEEGKISSDTSGVKIYSLTIPENEGICYLSLNIPTDTSNNYRTYISTKPVYALSDTGNFAFDDNFPNYQAKKNKKMCVIGPSTVALSRALKNSQYLVGFQEYLNLWYNDVLSLGYSTATWKNRTDNPSLYDKIVTGAVDLTDCDEFMLIISYVLLATTNTSGVEDLNGVIGEYDSTDTNTYMGGLNGVIDYILTQNPKAKIYLVNAPFRANVERRVTKDINNKLAQLSNEKSYQLLDMCSKSGINEQNYVEGIYSYDGTHFNQEGNKIFGEFVRKEIIGI